MNLGYFIKVNSLMYNSYYYYMFVNKAIVQKEMTSVGIIKRSQIVQFLRTRKTDQKMVTSPDRSA